MQSSGYILNVLLIGIISIWIETDVKDCDGRPDLSEDWQDADMQ